MTKHLQIKSKLAEYREIINNELSNGKYKLYWLKSLINFEKILVSKENVFF